MRDLRTSVARHYNELLVATLLASTLVEAALTGAGLAATALSTLVFLPLLARRRAPLLVLVVIFAVSVAGYGAVDDPPGQFQAWIALNVALYSAAAHLPL